MHTSSNGYVYYLVIRNGQEGAGLQSTDERADLRAVTHSDILRSGVRNLYVRKSITDDTTGISSGPDDAVGNRTEFYDHQRLAVAYETACELTRAKITALNCAVLYCAVWRNVVSY